MGKSTSIINNPKSAIQQSTVQQSALQKPSQQKTTQQQSTKNQPTQNQAAQNQAIQTDDFVYHYLLQSGWLVVLCTLIAWLALWVSVVFIQNLEVSALLKNASISYLVIIALGIPASLLLKVFSSFFEGISKPIVITTWLWLGVLVKVLINYVLLMSALGDTWQNANATAISTVLMHWFVVLAVLWVTRDKLLGLVQTAQQKAAWRPNISLLKRLLAFGLPIGFGYFGEFSIMPVVAALLAATSENMLATHQMLLSLTDITLGFVIAFTIASSVIVGKYHQQQALPTLTFSRFSETSVMAFMVLVGCAIWVSFPLWAGYMSEDKSLIPIMASALIAVWFRGSVEIGQILMAFNLRATKKGWHAMLINTLCVWLIGVGGIWLLQHYGLLSLAKLWWVLGCAYGLAWLLLRQVYYAQLKRLVV